jgi:hypothetical protein
LDVDGEVVELVDRGLREENGKVAVEFGMQVSPALGIIDRDKGKDKGPESTYTMFWGVRGK